MELHILEQLLQAQEAFAHLAFLIAIVALITNNVLHAIFNITYTKIIQHVHKIAHHNFLELQQHQLQEIVYHVYNNAKLVQIIQIVRCVCLIIIYTVVLNVCYSALKDIMVTLIIHNQVFANHVSLIALTVQVIQIVKLVLIVYFYKMAYVSKVVAKDNMDQMESVCLVLIIVYNVVIVYLVLYAKLHLIYKKIFHVLQVVILLNTQFN